MHGLKNSAHGFTLIEVLVALLITASVMGAMVTTFISQSKAYDAQQQINEMHQNARSAMDLMTREIRMAGHNPTGATFNAVNVATATQVQIRADLNGDGDHTDTDEDVTYTYDAVNLRISRNANGNDEILSNNIQAFNLAYLDSNGNTTAVLSAIREIQISITARTSRLDPNFPTNGGFRTYRLDSLVTPRNLSG